ncbi:MAG: amino acid adenylation domain-containing protein [Iphinoe sp. HA4291-MV1]|jgi:amino acid adenylation domain-containing protein|nr:amino acid adenylation domain-containing protein [Iphinoe sp. HA4291-MV1]
MNLVEFLQDLLATGIELWVDGDKLCYEAPEDVLTPELLTQIKQYKQEIIYLLQKHTDTAKTGPLSHRQKALWFFYQLAPNSAAYNVTYAARLVSNVDIPALRQAAIALIKRHSILRTTYTAQHGEPVQTIQENEEVCFSVQEAVNWSTDDIRNWVVSESDRPFDLSNGPVIRFNVLLQNTLTNASVAKEVILLMTVHHIVVDFWSLELLVSELRVFYEAIKTGQQVALPPQNLQYKDYVRWENQMLASQQGERLWNYWRHQLAGELPILNLPTDRPRPTVQTYEGASYSFVLEEKLTYQLLELAKAEGVTLYTILLAAFQVLLLRYTNTEDILISSPMAGRSLAEFEEIVGFFTNPVILRADLSGNPTFRDLLYRVRSCVLGALEHEDYPYALLVKRLQPLRDPSRSPLAQVALTWERSHQSEGQVSLMDSDGLIVESMITESRATILDLNLLIFDVTRPLRGIWRYNTDLFDEPTIERMAEHFQTLLAGIVANPIQQISTLSLLTETERYYLKSRGNVVCPSNPFITFGKQDIEQSIPARFQEQVRKHPHNIAVYTKNYHWTYSELTCRANQVAQTILQQCTFGEERIALLFEHDAPMVAGILGVLQVGKTYVPLDPNYPTDRVVYILEDSKASAVLTNNKNLARAQELTKGIVPLINIDNIDDISWTGSYNEVKLEISPDTIAYILYTSGSTGQPKGVVQNHRNVLHFIKNYTNNLHINKQDGLTLLSSYSFDAAIIDIFAAILNGATLYPINIKDEGLTHLSQWLRQHHITIYHSTPTLYRHFVSTLSGDEQLTNIRLVVLGGEEVVKTDVDLYKEHFSDECIFINVLGQTESSVTFQYFINKQTEITRNTVPVGYPVEETEIFLLNEAGEKTDIYGEIAIRSPYIALGYWQKPNLTQAVFLSDPECNYLRIYRTGDLGRLRPDGSIEFLGRIDNQVKIRGFRIELGEIEAVLSQHSQVHSVVVTARVDTPGAQRLVAYIVPQQNTAPTISELRQFLKTKLPEYMVPSAIVMLESLPLTPNGKIDRKALPAPELDRELLDKYIAPRTPIEEMLAAIWAGVLKVEQVGIHDNFFELGGHSLLATQLISRIRSTFKVELPLQSVFAAATVAQLAQQIQQWQQQQLELTIPPLLPTPRNADLPLSFAQTRLWFLDQLERNSAFYNIPAAVRLQGQLQLTALEQSLGEIIARHETLRTNFVTVDGIPNQIIHPVTNWTLSIVDCEDLPRGEQQTATQQLTQLHAQQPFDLANESLFRATLVVLSDTEHILLICMHHIVSDGWSMGVFVQELTVLYNAYSQGQPLPLAPLPIQYADFAVWQRQWLSGSVLQTQLTYWQQQLADAPALLSLPTDRPRPSVQTFTGGHLSFEVSCELTAALTQLSQQQGCTLFMTLLAAFDVLLCRYTNTSDILVGTPIANRNQSEIEGLIGFFVNTLVMRTDVSGNPSFGELLNRVRDMAIDAYAHQDLPFEMLVEALQPERSLSHTPLFQVMFVLQNAPMSVVEPTGLSVSLLPVESTTAKFDLTLSMQNTASGLVGVWEYNTDLFDSSTIERMAGQFQTLLSGIVANPIGQISQLPLLTEPEQQQLLIEWNDTTVDYPTDKCIHFLFESQVERTPNAVALVYENQQLTYDELNCRANQLAHYLQSLGVGPEVLVGICVERSLDMVVGLLGILKAGGAYVPLDPEYPTERLSFMLEDAAVSVLLTQQHLVERLPQHEAQLVCLDSDAQLISQSPQDNFITAVQATNLAYVIYTSGSTGVPKGVEVVHRGVNRLLFGVDYAHLDATQRFLQMAPISFDASTFEIWGALLHGARCVLYPGNIPTSKELCHEIHKHGITTLWLTAALFNSIIDDASQTLSGIEQLLIGGEALSVAHVQRASETLPSTQIINGYGPTESTTFTCCHPIGRPLETIIQSIPIGRPIANTQVYILDSHLQPVPIGVPGELHIGGAGLARGYLNRPELTTEKFIPNPFDNSKFQIPNSKLYKTGDLARYLPDGNIEYLGRIDNQVKIRGFRIELGEIEAVLSQHPSVHSVVVTATVDTPAEQRLVAYIVPQNQSAPTISELRQFLKTKLPNYMVPQAIVMLESLPLTPNGKVDRRALPTPELNRELLDKFVAPRTRIEEMLAHIWASVLKVEQVGIHDNFFELGGHSLLATQVISRLQEAFGTSLPLRCLFESPTIAQLSEVISSELQTGSGLTVPAILPVSRDTDIPLSWAQERLWFMHHLEGESGAYTIPLAVRLVGNLNIKALEQALGEMVQRHEVLRTRFEIKDNKPVQAIAPNITITLPVVDLQNVPDLWKQVKQLAKKEAYKPFDLANGPVLRVMLWQVSQQEYVLLLAIHHIAADGWSVSVLTRDLSAYYRAILTGSSVVLPELSVQYADFAVWQRQWLTTQVLERQLSYWKQQLTGAPPLLELPTDRPRPAIQTFQGSTERFQLDGKLTQQITKLSQESESTLFMTLLAGFVVLLSRYSGQTDLVIGCPIANRNRREIEPLIGFFVNTLALRFDFSKEATFEALLKQVRQVTQDAYDHQDLPFDMLVEQLQLERNLDRNPLVQVMFALQNAPSSPLDLPGLRVEQMFWGLDTVRFDLEVHFWEVPQGLEGVCYYNTDLFDAATIARMMKHFQTLLAAIVTNPEQPVALLPLLTQRERHQLLVEWNSTQADYPQNKCIHQLFEEQVERTPNAVALVYENQQLTYYELNCRANQLAHYLRSLGVGADVLVGICVERSLDMVVGLLGILKAGGAYVPLDPEYPQQRLSFMLEDAAVSVLLTQQHLVERLAEYKAQFVCLDTDWQVISQLSEENPIIGVQATNLAYVIYTSGSTGAPKGVLIAHTGLLNLVFWHQRTFEITPLDKATQLAGTAFDAAVWELWSNLTAGASIYLVKSELLSEPQQLRDWLISQKVTISFLPTPLAQRLLSLEWTQSLAMRCILTGGDKLHQYPSSLVPFQVVNNYGPTENTVVTTSGLVVANGPEHISPPIGRPIANTQVYILDSHLQPVPIGVPGELHIGGAGLALGYLNRPELTQDKFISNPFSDELHSRLYKTGDKARYLSNGNIEYLGRIDNQVKIRGFRIELGEIEAVLSQHPLIQESVVARVDTPNDQRLVAYLVPSFTNKKAIPQQFAQWQSEYVSDWQTLYEQAYSQPQASTDDVTFNIAGWNSSYTRQPIPDGEMQEWVESTVSRIKALFPKRALEIGCGTGLLLSRIAKDCQQYWGTDYSIAALQHVEQLCGAVEGLEHVRLLHKMADNFESIPKAEFDTVILNSIVQYFPSVEYLLQVLEGAMAAISQKGTIFVGDVRSLPLLKPYHAAVQLSQAGESRTIEQWQQQVHSSVAAEEELVIDPSFFIALRQRFPQIAWVEIQLKRGHSQNELTQFRYDVTLHVGTDVQTTVVPWLNWQLDGLSFRQIQNQLHARQPELLGIRRVPNQRVQQALQIWQWLEHPPSVETVGQLRQLLAQQSAVGINPEQFWELGQHIDYTVHLSWWESSQDGCYDVVFCRNSSTPGSDAQGAMALRPCIAHAFWDTQAVTTKPWTDYTNNPLHGKLVQKLVPSVREFIQQKLPNYMVPQAFVLLNALPLTPNGKVDRRSLPTPDAATRNLLATGFVSPRTPIEAQLVQIWSEVLGVERIGVKDNFFELGGHSLLATQVVSRINSAFGLDLSVQKMFEFPTVAGITSYMEVMNWAAEDLSVTQVSGEVVEF